MIPIPIIQKRYFCYEYESLFAKYINVLNMKNLNS